MEIVDMNQRTTQLSYALAIHPRAPDSRQGRTLRRADRRGAEADEGRLLRRAGEPRRDRLFGPRFEASVSPRRPRKPAREAAEEALRRKKVKVRWGHQLQALTVDGATLRAEVAKLDQVDTGYAVAGREWVVGRSATIRPAM
jgi:hypothetical protein